MGGRERGQGVVPYKVYVMLGFHASFHHSWRGDTPDEAGFGTDIRIVREILRILDDANGDGLQARGYWDFDVYWTLEEIIPRHAPDIIEGVRQRVQAGEDEVVLGYYNNGANHAATERELRTAIAYAVENPFGSGLRQLFGRASSVLRPQESMYTAGQNDVLLGEGVSGLVLYYSALPFNALSTFVGALPPEQRYNPLWLRTTPDEAPVVLWPCISPADLVDNVSLEALMLRLRQLQTSGQVASDLLVHVNFDADSDTWLPVGVPRPFAWFPNTGGLQEYIRIVNRYPWAAFTVPSEYRESHAPRGDVLVREDLADGGFDGNYSWAEKFTSLVNWTALERSRLHTYRAEALARRIPGPLAEEIRGRLWEGRDSSFFQRLVGLTTTHFGMSTPVINEERQAKAEALLTSAQSRAALAEREAALAVRRHRRTEGDALYTFEVSRPSCGQIDRPGAVRAVVRLPLVLPPGVSDVRVQDLRGEPVPASLVNLTTLLDGGLCGELMLAAAFEGDESRVYHVIPGASGGTPARTLRRLQNASLALCLSEETGVSSLTFEGQQVGASDFLEPFITYRSRRRPRKWPATGYRCDPLARETWNGLSRARLEARIPMEAPRGSAVTELQVTFTLFDHLPYLLVDVVVDYASTPPADTIHTPQQKLRRLLDLRWIEVAPFQLNPTITAPADHPLRVWKHNYLGVTSCYDLDYWRVNPRNSNLDSFNHQVTAGWVAVSNGTLGLLLAENADVTASMAFCPMRLRERGGVQRVSLNPFGSYYGRQLDYAHLGGNGLGAVFALAASGALRPNGPSYNGRQLAFSLLLAPYRGDRPPEGLQADALAHFYPAAVVYLDAPAGLDAVVPDDVRRWMASQRRRRRQQSDAPLPAPGGLLANPTDGAVDLVWEPPRDVRVTGYEVRWRETGGAQWKTQRAPRGSRWQVGGLLNGQRYEFHVRALADSRHSVWTRGAEAVPGPVSGASLFSFARDVPLRALLRMVGYSLAHVIRTRIRRRQW